MIFLLVMLKLMYITNQPEIAQIAENAGVDWIFVDMEFIGKDKRQGGLDTVQNHHTIGDVRNIKQSVSKAKVLVRVNPMHQALENYPSSEDEINMVIEAGADIVMLPFFHSVNEVKNFINIVGGRAKTCLLLETPAAAILIDEILQIPGIDMIHIGLNDLHLAMGMTFMFQLLTDGIVDQLSQKIRAKNIPFGFGGIARMNSGMLSGAAVLKEHYRLGSSMVIVSRSFCNADFIKDKCKLEQIFTEGIQELRNLEKEAENAANYFKDNHRNVEKAVDAIVELINKKI